MAWPPIIPPNNRQNVTPELDNHPSDHNLIADALTELTRSITRRVAGVSKGDASQTGIGTATVDITGMAVTFTADATRRYRARVTALVQAASQNANITVILAKADNSLLQYVVASVPNGYFFPLYFEWESAVGALSGSQTLKLQSNCNAGTATFYQVNGVISRLTVDDVGAY